MLGLFIVLTISLGHFLLKVEKKYIARTNAVLATMLKINYHKRRVVVDLRASSITADILNVLSDGKRHTMQEIADIVEVSERTVRRHVQSLSYRYPIETFCGGIERGGVRLDKSCCYGSKIWTKDEIKIMTKALKMLNNVEPSKEIENLLEIFK